MPDILIASTAYVAEQVAAVEGGALVVSTIEVDLGPIPRLSGQFIIPGTGMVVGKAVVVRQAVGPYTGKGTMPDEAVMDRIDAVASVTSPTEITVYWISRTAVARNFKFDYFIGG